MRVHWIVSEILTWYRSMTLQTGFAMVYSVTLSLDVDVNLFNLPRQMDITLCNGFTNNICLLCSHIIGILSDFHISDRFYYMYNQVQCTTFKNKKCMFRNMTNASCLICFNFWAWHFLRNFSCRKFSDVRNLCCVIFYCRLANNLKWHYFSIPQLSNEINDTKLLKGI